MASHNDSDHSRASSINLLSGRFGTTRKVLTGDYTVQAEGPPNVFLDPNGADRVVTLPPLIVGGGLFFIISNISTGNVLNVRSANGLDIDTVLPRQMMMFVSSEAEWITTAGLGRAAGPDHRAGQAPDPGVVPGAVRFLREDWQWGSVAVAGIVDAFKFMTDGTNTATGTGPDTFKFRSSDQSIIPVVTNNDVTHGDSLNIVVDPAHVNHNLLLNFDANKHIDHTAVNLTAGLGLSGGGNISASRQFDIAFNELAVVAPVLADFAVFHDVSANLPGAATWSSINAILDHNSLLNYVVNRHIDHSAVGITAGVGLSGGGDLTTTRTLNIDFTEFDALDAITAADLIPYYDVSEADHGTVTLAQFNAAIDHNSLLNYSAAAHLSSIADKRIIANISGGAAFPVANTLTGILDSILGTTQGAIIYRGAAAWSILAPGTSGNFLKTQGGGADPIWALPAGGGDVLAAGNNTFTGFNLFTTSVAFGTPLMIESTEAGAGVGPIFSLYRNSVSPANGDGGPQFKFIGNNSVGSQIGYGSILISFNDVANGSEDGVWTFTAIVNGVEAGQFNVGSGVYGPGTSGGGMGANSINMSSYYQDGISITRLFKNISAGGTGSNGNAAQPWFPTAGGVTLAANKTYRFRGLLWTIRSAGTTSHTTSILFAGTVTESAITALVTANTGDTASVAGSAMSMINARTGAICKAASTSATENAIFLVEGTIRTTAAGTFIPQFKYSAAPGGAPAIIANSFFEVQEIGTDTVNSLGTWS